MIRSGGVGIFAFGELVLFGSEGGNWWDLFCSEGKVGEQCGSFSHDSGYSEQRYHKLD